MKKRPVFVTEDNYQTVINMLDKAKIKNWGEYGTFYFHLLTAVITVITSGVVIAIVNFLNK
jgi:MFS superfamily sulfate permease-like transporter